MVLTARHVLSAAHCFINPDGAAISPSVFTVRVGSTYSMSGGSVHKVSTIVLHESYNNPTSNNDVAVVVLASRIRSFNSSTVRPAIVPPSGYVVPDNASVVAIGWGSTVMSIFYEPNYTYSQPKSYSYYCSFYVWHPSANLTVILHT
ncbi:unnamed protein product [Plutella xylostella]|uniref:(diamondback moth) hypothetical protein n=1 Tax=Plutella xylostella TaxID=51655 RepID=A0A8S4E168_PLUXY|nr:achelase-2 [Plutella xylostella]CAG9108997.1 unnamed protein product [Plutella xylostella]